MSTTHKAAFSATQIVLPIDFSASSEAALEAATGLAKQFHAKLHLVHIVPEFPDFNGSDFFPFTSVLQEHTQTIEQKLDLCKERLKHHGLHVTSSIETGNDIVGNLMLVIKRERADMIVISTHGLSGWRPLILGSIAEQVIKLASCTLLLLHSGDQGSTADQFPLHTQEDAVAFQAVAPVHHAPGVFAPETSAQKRLDRSAEELAEHGQRTEQHYDEAHSLFTK